VQPYYTSNLASPEPRLGLIADDLTGACDAGVQFAQRGLSSFVLLDLETQEHAATDLIILSTSSRDLAPDLARARVREACQFLIREQREIIYKKIDSTLRGNLGPEIAATMGEFGRSLALLAPAFPAMGRAIVEGRLRVAGRVSADSVHLPTLLRQQGLDNVVHLDCAVLRGGVNTLTRRLEESCALEEALVVFDAESQDNLRVIAQAAMPLRSRALMVGSAGFAAELATIVAAECQKQPPPTPERAVREGDSGSVVLILGSPHRVMAAQVEYFVAHRPATIIPRQGDRADELWRALKEKRNVILAVDPEADNAQSLAKFLRILDDCSVHGFILSGGDTAELACRALQATGIKLEREIAPGIPWGRLVGGRTDGMAIATKAGGFGEEDCLVTIVDFLAAREASRT
jgi:uncharacterized protein YgbK (DUF1537 family)